MKLPAGATELRIYFDTVYIESSTGHERDWNVCNEVCFYKKGLTFREAVKLARKLDREGQ